MNTLGLHIQSVYSELHRDCKIGSTRLLKHQVATWEAINDAEIDVVFNTAMTGDGKSLAGYLPHIRMGRVSSRCTRPTN